MNCCHQKTSPLGVWDDPQETDHAYNLSLCRKCGIIYKEDVWNDAGLRAILLDGTIMKITTDDEWQESGLLKNLEGELREVVIDLLRMTELAVRNIDVGRFDTIAFPAIRRVAKKLFEQERNELIRKISLKEIKDRYEKMERSEWYRRNWAEAINKIDSEAEATAKLADEYVEYLIQKA